MTEEMALDNPKMAKANQLFEEDNFPEAKPLYESILQTDPNNKKALDKLCQIAMSGGHYREALRLADRLMQITPDPQPHHYYYIGYILEKLRRIEDAITAHKMGLELEESASGYHKLAHLYRTNGRFGEAQAAYEKALELDPDHIASYYPYSNVHTFEEGDPLIKRVTEMVQNYEINGHNRIRLMFTMGKIQHDLGNYAEAFRYYQKANTMAAQEEPFDSEAHDKATHDLIKRYDQPRPLSAGKVPEMKHVPIFIVGPSRSGKSLTEWLLSEHPDITGASEGEEWYLALDTVFPPNADEKDLGRILSTLSSQQKARIGQVFQDLTESQCPRAPYVVHSLPFGYWFVGLMLDIFPHAKVIYCERDPVDILWACYSKYYQSRNGQAYDLGALEKFLKNNEEMITHWKELYGDKVMTSAYEKLCTDPTQKIEEILRFCGIEPASPPRLDVSTKMIGIGAHYMPFLPTTDDESEKASQSS